MVAAVAAALAVLHGGNLVVLNLQTGTQRVVMRHAGSGPVAWSADGKLVSSGGRIAGGPALPTTALHWAPAGERAAYVTRDGGVVIWGGARSVRVAPDGWGATSVAWSAGGTLAIGRALFSPRPHELGLWTWDGRRLRLAQRVSPETGEPYPVRWLGTRIVWWAYPDSASLAADGVALYAGTKRIGATLMYPDYVVACGSTLALADGGDRYSTHDKRIVLAGVDVSRNRRLSWVSPACSRNGRTLVAAAGRNWAELRFGQEHRSIWQLRPSRRRLTTAPAGASDEDPQLLPDGSIVFVRVRKGHATLERLDHGRLERVGALGTANLPDNYYGHYAWPQAIAVQP